MHTLKVTLSVTSVMYIRILTFMTFQLYLNPPPPPPPAGLESARKLQRLAVDHNELISTGGLRDAYTLLHLSCSHNHLTSVEGVESSALLATLDLRANSLMEVTTAPPAASAQPIMTRDAFIHSVTHELLHQ